MSPRRIESARICHDGASNEREVSQVLVDAIDECRADGVDPAKDPAVFIILTQLTHLLAGSSLDLARYFAAAKKLEII